MSSRSAAVRSYAGVLRRLLLLPLVLTAVLLTPGSASADGLDFDGVNDYVEAGLDPTASDSTTARTWEAWVKTTSSSSYQTVVGRYRHAGGQEPWILSVLSGVPTITLNGAAYRQADVTVNDGEWHHLAAVWEPGVRLDMYVDGELANGTQFNPPPSSLTVAADITMRLGVSWVYGGLYGFFDGEVDAVRYSKSARYDEDFEPQRCWDVDADTVGQWTFEEGSGTTTATTGLVTDAAELHNGVGWVAGDPCGSAGPPKDALRFDGTDDHVEVGEDPTAADNDSARTWEAWIKTTSNSYQAILGRFPDGGEAPWVLELEDGVPRVRVQNGSQVGARYAAATVNDGEWHHLAAVWVPGSRLDLYIDGERSNGVLGGGAVPASVAVAADASIRIGVGDHEGDLYGHFDGDIDGVRYSEGARYDEDFEPQRCWTVDADTIAQWSFDAGSGTTTPSVGQLAEDAELVNGVTWIAGEACEPSPSGTALAFDGSDDYVEAGLDPTASDATTARTWEGWVKTTSNSSYQTVVGRYRHAIGQAPWILTVVSGAPTITLNGAAYREANVTVNDGEWHHVAAVWEPGARMDIYVDGELANGTLAGTVPASLTVAADITMRLGVGHLGGSLYGYFDGEVDAVHYSKSARYSGSFTPDVSPDADADTVALWNFSEGAGTTTATEGDVTADATLLNGVGWTTGP